MSLEDEYSGQPSEVDNDQLRAIIEADHLTTNHMRSCQCRPFYGHVTFQPNGKGEKA